MPEPAQDEDEIKSYNRGDFVISPGLGSPSLNRVIGFYVGSFGDGTIEVMTSNMPVTRYPRFIRYDPRRDIIVEMYPNSKLK